MLSSEIMKCEHEIKENQREQAAPPTSLVQAKELLRTEQGERQVLRVRGKVLAWLGVD